MSKAAAPKRGEVWDVDFDPPQGAEIGKTRPAIVMSEDTVGRLPLRIVVPVTDSGLLVFSDGSTTKTGELPDDAGKRPRGEVPAQTGEVAGLHSQRHQALHPEHRIGGNRRLPESLRFPLARTARSIPLG